MAMNYYIVSCPTRLSSQEQRNVAQRCANYYLIGIYELGNQHLPALLLGHWYEIMALYYVKSILTEISASRQDRRVLQKSKIIRIEFLSKWGILQTSRYI